MTKWMFFLLFISASLCGEESFKIGSKRFTESYILGEIIKDVALQTNEAQVVFKPGLGNTGIVFAALQEGSIDVYPEYTGTIAQEFLKLGASKKINLELLNAKLRPFGIGADIFLGFSNSYALAMREEEARELNIKRISDLLYHPHLKMGLSQEFLKRTDGWEELKKAYNLPQSNVTGIDHSLSYEALKTRQINVIDIYSTDPKIEKYGLLVLEDDHLFFPLYDAILLYRLDVPGKFPLIWKALQSLEGSISTNDMLAMNAKAELFGEQFAQIAQDFLSKKENTESTPRHFSFLSHLLEANLGPLILQHLFLVFGSLLPAILVGIPLGVLATYCSSLRHIILNFVGVIQTIPSLALFAFLIPILQQIGSLPALIALFFYALFPIVRNTYAGLSDLPNSMRESAIVLGLPLLPRLAFVEIPLSARPILAGIKTAAVMNVGMATIAALIGAGGLGELIVTGLALNNTEILLSGAIPACLLAIFVQLGFDCLDYWLVPKGLRL
jgi:osmoprotectant transport system permease protein